MRSSVAVLGLVLAGCSALAPPAPAPTASPFVAPTSAATPSPPHGTGIITFGSAGTIDKETLKINPSRDSFKVGTRKIAWSASFSEPAGATRLTELIAKVGSGGTEALRYSYKFDLSNPTFDILSATEDLGAYVNRKPGTYVLRILRGATTLAEGQFKLTK